MITKLIISKKENPLKSFRIIFLLVTFVLAGCINKESLRKTLDENPDLIYGVIEKHPKEFIEAVNKAAMSARAEQQKSAEAEQAKQMEDEFKNPKNPVVDLDHRTFEGPKEAPVTIVEYSDFQCPFCARGYYTMNEILKANPKTVKLIYKHLIIKPMGEITARYYESIGLQNREKAKKFHDSVFEHQAKLHDGESFLQKTAKTLGVNMAQLKKDLHSEAVTKIINEDKAEGQKFGFTGTPGFLVNGVALRGAYPQAEFQKVIDRHLKDAKK